MKPPPYKYTPDGLAIEPDCNRWGLSVWIREWRTIFDAERLAAERRSWQPGRLRSLISGPELAYVLGCYDQDGPAFNDAAEIHAGRRQPTPDQIEAIRSYLAAKLDRAFPTKGYTP